MSPPAAGASPGDLALAALYLSSAASDYGTGTVLTVDGGWMGQWSLFSANGAATYQPRAKPWVMPTHQLEG